MEHPNFINKIKLDPTISIGHIGSVIFFIITGLGAWYNLKQDVSNAKTESTIRFEQHDKKLAELDVRNREQDLSIREMSMELKQQMRSNAIDLKEDLKNLRSDIFMNFKPTLSDANRTQKSK